MPSYTGLSLGQIKTAIMAGTTGSFDTAGSAFESVRKELDTVSRAINANTSRVVTPDHWQGDAATAFATLATKLTHSYVDPTTEAVAPYQGAMARAKAALANA